MLSLDLTLYKYTYSNLQVSSQNTSTGVPVTTVTNAASASQKGVDLVANYKPRIIKGLSLYGAVDYNPTSYNSYIAPCWIGQSIAEGCNLQPAPNGQFASQDVGGHQLINAPTWSAAASVSYMMPLSGSGMNLEMGVGTNYRSSYNPAPDFNVAAEQQAYWIFDAQMRLFNEDQGWDVAVIGKNLANVYRAQEAANVPLTGNSAATGTSAGGVGARPDLNGVTNTGLAVFLQVTLRPTKWVH
jgi:outer membrane receptor protein involved in Fe transport